MAFINDCSPEEIDAYHALAIAEVEKQLRDLIASLDDATAGSGISSLQDQLDAMISTTGVSASDVRSTLCALPRDPTQADLEAQIQSPDFQVISGRLVFPGPLDITALKRLFTILRTVNAVTDAVPEFFLRADDPVYGVVEIPTRLLVLNLRIDTVETPGSACDPEGDDITETEVLVSVDEPVSTDDDRIIVCVWIGPVNITGTIYSRMREFGFQDDEIRDIILGRNRDDIQVYTMPDPPAVWSWMSQFLSEDNDEEVQFLESVLTRGPDSIKTQVTMADMESAYRSVLNTPPGGTCGVHPALALFATMDSSRMYPTGDGPGTADGCTNLAPRWNSAMTEVGRVMSAMGVIEQAINRTQAYFQKKAGPVFVAMSDWASMVEQNLVSVSGSTGTANYNGNLRVGGLPENFASTGTVSGPGTTQIQKRGIIQGSQNRPSIPGMPDAPVSNNVAVLSIQQYQQQAASYYQVAQQFIDMSVRICTGMSLLACTLSAFGSKSLRLDLPVSTAPRINQPLPECANQGVLRHVDVSVLNKDFINSLIAQLHFLLQRMRALIDAMNRQTTGPEALFNVDCDITETAQLGIDIARRLTAANFGG